MARPYRATRRGLGRRAGDDGGDTQTRRDDAQAAAHELRGATPAPSSDRAQARAVRELHPTLLCLLEVLLASGYVTWRRRPLGVSPVSGSACTEKCRSGRGAVRAAIADSGLSCR